MWVLNPSILLSSLISSNSFHIDVCGVIRPGLVCCALQLRWLSMCRALGRSLTGPVSSRAVLEMPLVHHIAWGPPMANENTTNRTISISLVAFDWIRPGQLHLSNDPNQTSQVSFPVSCPVGGSSRPLAGYPRVQGVWGDSCWGQVSGLGDEP